MISVAERQAYIGRVRDLAKAACATWMECNGWAGVSDRLASARPQCARGLPARTAIEEIPARMQAGARNDLARLFAQELDELGVIAEAIDVWSTPRRLALVARGLPLETLAVSEEIKGPRTSAPPQALEGFLRKVGLPHEQLQDRDGVWFAVVEKAGRPMHELLGPIVERIVRDFPWPKSMRWGAVVRQHGIAPLGPAASRHRRAARRGDRAGRDRRHYVPARRPSVTVSIIRARSLSEALTITPRSCAPVM